MLRLSAEDKVELQYVARRLIRIQIKLNGGNLSDYKAKDIHGAATELLEDKVMFREIVKIMRKEKYRRNRALKRS